MPRPSKGPYLYHDKQRGLLYIRDGQLKRGNSFNEADRASAERALAEYIIKKHDPQKALNKDHPNKTKIADVMALEMKRIATTAMPDHRKKELITVCENIGDWFGGREIGDLDGDLQERYAAERRRYVMKKIDGKRTVVKTDEPAPIAAYRDLKMLAAAINRFFKKKVGGVWTRFSPVLPDAPQARERWLSRDEAANLIWTAWRKRRDSGISGKPGRHTSRHLARYILVGLYTGSRDGDICNAALMPTIGRGYVDLDRGIFKRKPDNKKETSKKQPTVPLPPRLLAHMRRWQRLGISSHSVIESTASRSKTSAPDLRPWSRPPDWRRMIPNRRSLRTPCGTPRSPGICNRIAAPAGHSISRSSASIAGSRSRRSARFTGT